MARSSLNHDRVHYFIGVFFSLAQLSSCATLHRPREPALVPVVFQPLFRACAPIENEAALIISKDGARVFSSQVVWSFQSARKAAIQVNTPMGDTIYEISRNNQIWDSTSVSKLNVFESSSGVLNVEGHDIPLKSDEIGCVLSGVWPAEWLSSMAVNKSSASELRLQGADGFRDVHVDVSRRVSDAPFRNSEIKSCATLEWGGLWMLFRKSVRICRDQVNDGINMRVSGLNNYLVEWKISDES